MSTIDKELTRASKRAIETLGEKDIYYIFTPLMPNTSTRIILKKPKTDSSIRKVWLPENTGLHSAGMEEVPGRAERLPRATSIRTSIWLWHFPMDGPARIVSSSKNLQSSVRTQGYRRWSFILSVIPVPPTN